MLIFADKMKDEDSADARHRRRKVLRGIQNRLEANAE
jgi:hypothetical protein